MGYQPRHLIYRNRYDVWLIGVCPYCKEQEVQSETFIQKLRHGSIQGIVFRCNSCGAENKFTNPKVRRTE